MREFDAIPGSTGRKIIDGLKEAVAGNFSAVLIEGQRWVRADTAGWQPIDSAPKDGTHILAITMEYWKPLNGLHRWVHSRVIETYWVGPLERFAMGERKQPTHWLPIPPLPTLPTPEAQP